MSSTLRHIGIIMDGNGRWATKRKLPRTAGHRQGITTAKKIIKEAIKLEIPWLTLYVFSTENWKRTQKEVGFLMKLIISHMKNEASFYHENKIRVRHTGDMKGLPEDVQYEIKKSIRNTKDYSAITVNLAINYGGRNEIIRAFRKWTEDEFKSSKFLNEETFQSYLDNTDLPDPDLIIRSAGDQRSSNFLLWESAYSEYYFSDKLWPDFTEKDLHSAVENFESRNRKFGGLN
ncbi:MAG: di-trans,poly-cis-decaprenylcistransferase [Spirochaetales bacterium]|nr:di-trans,poly-cis-decaprenylcistransferase [Spirochaetales bacterium]